jgi:hypothetical protein
MSVRAQRRQESSERPGWCYHAGMSTTMVPLLATVLCIAQATAGGGRLAFTAPDGWQPRPSASAMRVAEFVLPKADGDVEDGELIVYYFGGQGGDAETNITRWIGQMQQPDGRPSAAVARRSTQTVNGLAVALLDISGTYVAEVRPGSSEHHNKPGFRMRAAVVPTPRGPYFVKMLGPQRTMDKWGASFTTFLDTVRFEAQDSRRGILVETR